MRGGDHPGILASFRLAELTPDEIRDATAKLITEMRGKYDEVRARMNDFTVLLGNLSRYPFSRWARSKRPTLPSTTALGGSSISRQSRRSGRRRWILLSTLPIAR